MKDRFTRSQKAVLVTLYNLNAVSVMTAIPAKRLVWTSLHDAVVNHLTARQLQERGLVEILSMKEGDGMVMLTDVGMQKAHGLECKKHAWIHRFDSKGQARVICTECGIDHMHEWVEMSSHGDTERRAICTGCDGERSLGSL